MPKEINGVTMLDIKEVAAKLSVNYRTVLRLIKAKRIEAFLIGGKWWMKEETVETYIARSSNIVEVPAA